MQVPAPSWGWENGDGLLYPAEPYKFEFLSTSKSPSLLARQIDLWSPLVTGKLVPSPNHLFLKAAEAGVQEEGGIKSQRKVCQKQGAVTLF